MSDESSVPLLVAYGRHEDSFARPGTSSGFAVQSQLDRITSFAGENTELKKDFADQDEWIAELDEQLREAKAQADASLSRTERLSAQPSIGTETVRKRDRCLVAYRAPRTSPWPPGSETKISPGCLECV